VLLTCSSRNDGVNRKSEKYVRGYLGPHSESRFNMRAETGGRRCGGFRKKEHYSFTVSAMVEKDISLCREKNFTESLGLKDDEGSFKLFLPYITSDETVSHKQLDLTSGATGVEWGTLS